METTHNLEMNIIALLLGLVGGVILLKEWSIFREWLDRHTFPKEGDRE